MSDENVMAPDASVLGRPNSYIGRSVPRPNARRLLTGQGRFVDDIKLKRMVHVAFVRSPYANALISGIDTAAAAESAGVVRVVTGKELAEYCSPWVGVLTHFKTLKSAPQHALAVNHASWQGEAVAAVVAQSRAEAEALFDSFHKMCTEEDFDAADLAEVDEEAMERLQVLSGVRQFPVRVKCATLDQHSVLFRLSIKENQQGRNILKSLNSWKVIQKKLKIFLQNSIR
jgi:xanthine dehydrogenase molybdopterin-binding subunit B